MQLFLTFIFLSLVMLLAILLLGVLVSPGESLVRRRRVNRLRVRQPVQKTPSLPEPDDVPPDTQLDPPDLHDKLVLDMVDERDAKFITGSDLPTDVQVGELTLGSQRFLYTYVNSSGLVTAAGMVAGGFLLVAVALFLYDYFVLGGGQSYDRREDLPIPDYDYDNNYFDASRIRRYVPND